jgi:hypothetical protein
MPAQILARAIAMVPDAGAESSRFSNQLVARHPFQIIVHAASRNEMIGDWAVAE